MHEHIRTIIKSRAQQTNCHSYHNLFLNYAFFSHTDKFVEKFHCDKKKSKRMIDKSNF